MQSLQFYEKLKAIVAENNITNISVSFYENRVILKASFFNFTTLSAMFFLTLGVIIALVADTLLVLGILMVLATIFSSFTHFMAINKVTFDFNTKEVYVADLRIFSERIIELDNIKYFKLSSTHENNVYKRFRVDSLLKTGEQIILIDVSDEEKAIPINNLFNLILQ